MPLLKIVEENATTFKDKREVHALTEADMNKISNYMITSLYKNAINKSHIDYEDIPKSAGDITKYSGYTSITTVVSILNDVCAKEKIKAPEELLVLSTAINNMQSNKDRFEKGFKLNKEFIILNYNIITLALVDATSSIVNEFIDFAKRPDRIEFTIKPSKIKNTDLVFGNLRRFNSVCKSGEFGKVMDTVISTGKEEFLGVDDVASAAIVIGAIAALVPLTRELIYYFYNSKMVLRDNLKHQAMFLEINKNNIDSLSKPAREKQQILKKQDEIRKKFLDMSDKLDISKDISTKKTIAEIKQENKQYKLADVQHEIAKTDVSGFQLL